MRKQMQRPRAARILGVLSLLCVLPLLLTGCRSNRQIETAAVIENVSVHKANGQLYYTFYLLGDSDRPNAVAVPAGSFREARRLAEERYIPHLSLAKLELLLIRADVCADVMRGDIEYISTQASFSPVARVALCDDRTLRRLRTDPDAQELIGRQIDLLHEEQPRVRASYLSVFNSYARRERFWVPLITCDGALKVSPREMTP